MDSPSFVNRFLPLNFVALDTINGWPISIFLNLVFAHFSVILRFKTTRWLLKNVQDVMSLCLGIGG